MNDRLRNTTRWYEGRDPLSVVDGGLIEIIHRGAGHRVLDLGCGLGGYAARMQQLGHDCAAIDINPVYVDRARSLGVDATLYDGAVIPFPDASFDTVFAVEVLEHVADSAALVREVGRVARGGFIATVPNCTQRFPDGSVVFEHMLDSDHKNFFTVESLTRLLASDFDSVRVEQIAPVDAALAQVLLPRTLYKAYRVGQKLGLLKPRQFFRLVAHCEAPRRHGAIAADRVSTR